jgi:hypothetical protein
MLKDSKPKEITMKKLMKMIGMMMLLGVCVAQTISNCESANNVYSGASIQLNNWSQQTSASILWSTTYDTPTSTASATDTSGNVYSSYLSPAPVEGNGALFLDENVLGLMPGTITVTWTNVPKGQVATTVSVMGCQINNELPGSLVGPVYSKQSTKAGSDTHGVQSITTGVLTLSTGKYLVFVGVEGGATQMHNYVLPAGFFIPVGVTGQHGIIAFANVTGPQTLSYTFTWSGIALHSSSILGAVQQN